MRKFFFAGLLAVAAGAFAQAAEAQATLSVPNALAAGDEITITYSGKLKGDELHLTRKVGDFATEGIVLKRDGGGAATAK